MIPILPFLIIHQNQKRNFEMQQRILKQKRENEERRKKENDKK